MRQPQPQDHVDASHTKLDGALTALHGVDSGADEYGGLMRRRFFLIFNPNAGTSRLAVVEDIVARLVNAGATIERCSATSAAGAQVEARIAAQSGRFDAIVAAGGDGTVRQAAIAATGTHCPVGAVMLGTGNVLAYELGLPRTAAALAAMLMQGPTLSVELGRANTEPFLLMAGVGFDGRIMAALSQHWKQRIKKAAFIKPVLGALARPLDVLSVNIDGLAHTATWAVITSARFYGGNFTLTAQTSIREPGLRAILFQASSKPQLIGQLMTLARSGLDVRATRKASGITSLPCERAVIRSLVSVPAQVDGDTFGSTPLEVTRGGGTVQLIVDR
jgi:diacylglycerol kinase (ATP)